MQNGPGWSGVILISLIMSVGAVFGARVAVQQGVLPEAIGPAHQEPAPKEPETATVPPLEGLSLESAKGLLESRRLTLVVKDKQPHESIPADSVAAQEPLSGSILKVDSAVSVTLSTGKPSETTVPELAGKSPEEAIVALQNANLKVGEISGPDSGERHVESTEPAAGATVPTESSVALTVVPSGVEVPKLTGLRFAKAKAEIKKSGFELGKVRDRYASRGAPLVILDQTPAPGTLAPKGSAIDLVRNAPD